MSMGFYLKGTHGVVQIDENYQNYFVVASGTANIGSSANQGLGSLVTVSLGYTLTDTSLVCLSSPSAPYDPAVTVIASATGNTSIQVFSPLSNGAAFKWWIYDKLTSVASSGFGMWFKKPGTYEPIYDTTQKPLRILGQYPVGSPGFSGGLHNSAVGISSDTFAGKVTGAISMHLPSTTWSGPSGGPGAVPNYYYITCYNTGGTGFYGTVGRFETFNGGADTAIGTAGSVLITDMTGY